MSKIKTAIASLLRSNHKSHNNEPVSFHATDTPAKLRGGGVWKQALYALCAVLLVCGLLIGGAEGDESVSLLHQALVNLAGIGMVALAVWILCRTEDRNRPGSINPTNDGCGKYYGTGPILDFRTLIEHKGMTEDLTPGPENLTPDPSPTWRGEEEAARDNRCGNIFCNTKEMTPRPVGTPAPQPPAQKHSKIGFTITSLKVAKPESKEERRAYCAPGVNPAECKRDCYFTDQDRYTNRKAPQK